MRKVLSFVLVLTLVLSSFSMAFAATPAASLTDIAGNANQDAIQVNYDLGIVTGNPDGTFLPAKAVNRAEFAAMLTRALDIPDSALAGYTATSFKDTAGYGWAVPYLAFCQSKGILLGDGAGNVMPGRTITVNEAMTMALRAVGYTANSSLLVGAWPSNYVSIAQNNDLYDSVAKTTTVDKANAAQIIYNLLTVQKVAVNSDGTTDYLWDGDEEDGIEANLLNTNLGCTQEEDVVLGDAYSYEDAIINITNDIGAFGTAYLNSDDELVAFTKDSVALTGSVNDDGDFEVGDVTYSFADDEDITDAGIEFVNTSKEAVDVTLTSDTLDTLGDDAAFSDNGDITINVDLSGKKIKDVYSVVGWVASDTALADSDVQDEINDDSALLDNDFATDDDDAIDQNSFALVGVASLDKIAEDNVVYVYADDEYIRKVAVGTETVEGTIDEVNDDGDVITVGGKDYDVAAIADYGTFGDNDVDADGKVYLDAYGEVYDFDGTAKVDTYGVVKAASAETDFDNYKVKLYTSDDSTKTYYLSEEAPADIDWTSESAATTIDAVTAQAVEGGGLIGYSLDADGNIDAINNLATSDDNDLKFKSSKVLGDMSINSDCVVFTYAGEWIGTSTADYGVSSLGDIDAGTIVGVDTAPAFYILNDDGDVAAMFISDAFTNGGNDDVYAVFNSRRATTNDGDEVYKYTGFVDGTAFTYFTNNRNDYDTEWAFNNFDQFGVYAVTLDADNTITEIAVLADNDVAEESVIINVTNEAEDITDLASDNTVITTDNGKYTVADDAVVYKYSEDDEEFTVSKLSSIDEGDTVALYDTKGSDADGIATVVIYIAN